MLVNACFFKQRGIFFYNLCDYIGMIGIEVVISLYNNSIGTQAKSQPHRHSRVNPEFAGFIATGSNHSSVAFATNQDELPNDGTVSPTLNAYKKRIQITMYNLPCQIFKNLCTFDYIIVNSATTI